MIGWTSSGYDNRGPLTPERSAESFFNGIDHFERTDIGSKSNATSSNGWQHESPGGVQNNSSERDSGQSETQKPYYIRDEIAERQKQDRINAQQKEAEKDDMRAFAKHLNEFDETGEERGWWSRALGSQYSLKLMPSITGEKMPVIVESSLFNRVADFLVSIPTLGMLDPNFGRNVTPHNGVNGELVTSPELSLITGAVNAVLGRPVTAFASLAGMDIDDALDTKYKGTTLFSNNKYNLGEYKRKKRTVAIRESGLEERQRTNNNSLPVSDSSEIVQIQSSPNFVPFNLTAATIGKQKFFSADIASSSFGSSTITQRQNQTLSDMGGTSNSSNTVGVTSSIGINSSFGV